jgi:hypothetical protein
LWLIWNPRDRISSRIAISDLPCARNATISARQDPGQARGPLELVRAAEIALRILDALADQPALERPPPATVHLSRDGEGLAERRILCFP